MPQLDHAAGRHALVIGIDEYPYVDAQPLHGCCNDARLMTELLETHFDFQPQEITRLLDTEATRENILGNLEAILQRVQNYDVVCVHFSGHGSRWKYGDRHLETLVPHDSGRDEHENRDIYDLELAQWLEAVGQKTPYVTLSFDSCHAGHAARQLTGTRLAPTDDRSGAEFGRTMPAAAEALLDSERGASGWLPKGNRYTLLAACRADEVAREMREPKSGRHHGVFSFHLAETVRSLPEDATYEDLFERLRTTMGDTPMQHPVLEGVYDREVLGQITHPTKPFLCVSGLEMGDLLLEGGEPHGVTVGSEWDLYPPGSCRIFADAESVGRMCIDRVGASQSWGSLTEASGSDWPTPPLRAVLRCGGHALPRLLVEVPGTGTPIEAMRERLQQSQWLTTGTGIDPLGHGEGKAQRSFVVRRDSGDHPAHLRTGGSGGVAHWWIRDTEGRLAMKPVPVDAPDALGRVAGNLDRWARHHALRDLQPSDSECRKALVVHLERRDPEGGWVRLESGALPPIVVPGDILRLSISNAGQLPLHLAILDLGLTGAVQLLYPVRGGVDALGPGARLDLRGHGQWQIALPEGYPFCDSRVTGVEHFLVVATTEVTDFGALAQAGVRLQAGPEKGPKGRGFLGNLLRSALGECRDAVSLRPHGTWTVERRDFLVRTGLPNPRPEGT